MDAEEAGQSMAVVLHEVWAHTHIHMHARTHKHMYTHTRAQTHTSSHNHHPPSTAKDKKYYPSAEEVYGPEVEVRAYTCVCACMGVCMCVPNSFVSTCTCAHEVKLSTVVFTR